MTVETTTTKARYVGNGAATVYPVPFPVSARAHVQCIARATNGAEYVPAFSVTGTVPSGASVVFTTPPPAGTLLVIYRQTPELQLMDLENGGSFDAETLERSADNLEMQIQEIKEAVDRAAKVSMTADGAPEPLDTLFTAMTAARDRATAAASEACACATDAAASAADAKSWDAKVAATGAAWDSQIQAEGGGQITRVQSAGDTAVASIRHSGEVEVTRAATEADRAENAARAIPGFANNTHTFFGFNIDNDGHLIVTRGEEGDIMKVSDFAVWDILPAHTRFYLNNGSLMLELPFQL